MQSKKYLKIIISMIPSQFPFFNLPVKEILFHSSVKKANPFVWNKKGFTVIGVLVASAIGLIVVTGLSQMFANIHTQLRQMEQKAEKIFLNNFIGSELTGSGCINTLKPHSDSIIQGKDIDSFSKLRDETDHVILDLSTLSTTLHNTFQLKCTDGDPTDCECDGKSSPCEKKWTLSFISQSTINNLPVYNRNFSVDLPIKYTSATGSTLDKNKDADKDSLDCNNVSNVSASGGPGISSGDCIHIDEASGLIVLGCGTTNEIREKTTTAYGHNAGYSGTGRNNTFMGFEAGQNTTGYENTFLGGNAGKSNTTGFRNTFLGFNAGLSNTTQESNVFVGYNAGKVNTGSSNIFIGPRSGRNNSSGYDNTFVGSPAGYSNTIGKKNVFVGGYAGFMNDSGEENTFIGLNAGRFNSTGIQNTFVGNDAGLQSRTGNNNTFVGNDAGLQSRTGNNNTFVGNDAGLQSRTGNNNTFVGFEAGKKNTSDSNTFVGYHAGLNNSSGKRNTFLGRGAGWNNTGSGNIFIGHNATDSTANNELAVGNTSHPRWIAGTIGSNFLSVNGLTITTSSSRTLKKNIQPYKSFDKALEDILKTPLFTYEYKKDHPEKSRMGIISEELPKHLRLKDNSNISNPDWSSIYGTFWASIKALHEMIVDLKQDISSKFKVFISHVENLKGKLEKLIQEFSKFQTEWADLKKHFESADKDLAEKAENFSKELVSTKAQLSETNKQLDQTSQKLAEVKKALKQNDQEFARHKKALEQNHKEIQALKKQIQNPN